MSAPAALVFVAAVGKAPAGARVAELVETVLLVLVVSSGGAALIVLVATGVVVAPNVNAGIVMAGALVMGVVTETVAAGASDIVVPSVRII